MKDAVKPLILTYKVSILLGLVIGTYNAYIVSIMATGAPTAGSKPMFIGASIGFLVVAIPMIVLPWFAKREVTHFVKKRHLKISYTTAFLHTILGTIGSWIFLPFGVMEIVLVYKLKKSVNTIDATE